MSSAVKGKVRRTVDGVHYFDRVSGLNVLFDEVAVAPEEFDAGPRYVSIALTNACDLHCPFCYAPKSADRLEPDDVLRWVRELAQAGTLGVGFGGGEPTVHPDFAAICRRTAEETDLAVSFTTHGHRIDGRLAAALRGYIHFIRVSVDGVGSTYEAIRGRSFDALRAQLEIIASISPFGINTVVNDATLDELDEVATLAREAGARELLLLPEQAVGLGSELSDCGYEQLATWISEQSSIRLAISEARVPDGVPLAEPFTTSGLDEHAHVDARAFLRATAFDATGVATGDSILESLEQLREELT